MRRVEIGVIVLGVLGLADALSAWLFPAPPEAPPGTDLVGLVLGALTVVLLAVWWARRTRGLLIGGAVVLRALSALLAVPALIFGVDGALWVTLAVLIVITVIGIVLVAPAMSGRSSRAVA